MDDDDDDDDNNSTKRMNSDDEQWEKLMDDKQGGFSSQEKGISMYAQSTILLSATYPFHLGTERVASLLQPLQGTGLKIPAESLSWPFFDWLGAMITTTTTIVLLEPERCFHLLQNHPAILETIIRPLSAGARAIFHPLQIHPAILETITNPSPRPLPRQQQQQQPVAVVVASLVEPLPQNSIAKMHTMLTATAVMNSHHRCGRGCGRAACV
jgi:hypothetical protein